MDNDESCMPAQWTGLLDRWDVEHGTDVCPLVPVVPCQHRLVRRAGESITHVAAKASNDRQLAVFSSTRKAMWTVIHYFQWRIQKFRLGAKTFSNPFPPLPSAPITLPLPTPIPKGIRVRAPGRPDLWIHQWVN